MAHDDQGLLPTEERDYYEQYFLRIEELFAALRSRSLLLSPADYQLARTWYDRGIPLSCVLRGIRAAFFRKMSEADPDDEVVSLNWCRWAVMNEWKEYKSASSEEKQLVPPEKTGDEAAAILDSAVFDLRRAADERAREGEAAFAEALNVVIGEAESLRAKWKSGEFDIDSLEERLRALDERMMSVAANHAPEEIKKKIELSVERKLKQIAREMSAGEREATRAAAFAAKLRQGYRLPKITLYTLVG